MIVASNCTNFQHFGTFITDPNTYLSRSPQEKPRSLRLTALHRALSCPSSSRTSPAPPESQTVSPSLRTDSSPTSTTGIRTTLSAWTIPSSTLADRAVERRARQMAVCRSWWQVNSNQVVMSIVFYGDTTFSIYPRN